MAAPVERLDAGAATQDALVSIARLEDARGDGGGLLEIFLGRGEPELRARAATALGRLPIWRWRGEVTRALVAALDDEDEDVRSAAAFALGMRADAGAEAAILAHLNEPRVAVRARLIEAASKIATPALQEAVLEALADPATPVRIEAAQGAYRFPTQGAGSDATKPTAQVVDAALIETASRARPGRVPAGPAPDGGEPQAAPEPTEDPEVAWRALFSLSRRASAAAREVFLEYAVDPQAHRLSRFFALKGLTALADPEAEVSTEDLRETLEQVTGDPDNLLAHEAAAGLARLGDPRSIEALSLLLGRQSAHLRAQACTALGRMHQARERAGALIVAALDDPSATVRAAALEAHARLHEALHDKEVVGLLEVRAADPDPLARHAAAITAARLEADDALPILLPLTTDDRPFVSTAATSALAAFEDPRSVERAWDLLLGADNGLRLAAAQVLREQAMTPQARTLRRAWELSVGDGGSEVRVELLRYANEMDAIVLGELLPLALRDPDPFVRYVASGLGSGEGAILADARARGSGGAGAEAAQRAAAGPNPWVEVTTSRGTMVFELFPAEAPLHVYSFLQLASEGHYDGLDFHRVVPGFVVQGGCYRGDGNGGGDWRGGSLRHEIGARKYRVGSLGMPRWEDPESGGSQFFVTHVPTPHLDGRYTLFGELRSGFDVLEAIEVGDRLLHVRLR
jgi:cyclophilin family peptidyl-prolyl cis-trans isomerase/HEAT repeat protein